MSEEKITVLVVGDAPNTTTGLARIARDLISGLMGDRELLGIQVFQLGLNYDGSLQPWFVFPVLDIENWGAQDLLDVYQQLPQPVVVFSIWDPARCLGLRQVITQTPDVPIRMWGYFPVDAWGPSQALSGPVLEVLQGYDRVLGYGEWGAGVLGRTLGRKVQWLPHGVKVETWWRARWEDWMARPDRVRVGCVATNQPRKDLGLVFAAMKELKTYFANPELWLHVDKLVTQFWSIPQLAMDFGFNDPERLIVTTPPVNDDLLLLHYQACDVTIAPGLGEGFGYPIVESLAAGTPVIHGSYGGGASLIPQKKWVVDPGAYRLEGAYNLVRPVYKAFDFADAMAHAIEWKKSDPQLVEAYCRRSVAHLDWRQLWPRWRTWFRQGLEEVRRGLESGGDSDSQA